VGGPDSADDFVVGLAREIVAELAPGELSVFDPVSQAFLRDPHSVLTGRGRPGAVLGSGIDVVVLVLSPVALALASAVRDYLLGKVGEVTVKRATRWARRLRRKRDPEVIPPITAELRDGAAAGTLKVVEDLTRDPALARQCAEIVRIVLDRRC
jgi:hypothetical protein